MQRSSAPSPGFDANRVQTLADGIFAIAMTLLVLDLKDEAKAASGFWAHLAPLAPKLFAYVISFLILGLYWTGHNAEFHYIRRTNRLHLWLNIVLLMGVGLIPFSASLLADPEQRRFAIPVYCGNLVFISAAFLAHWSYATRGHRLVDSTLDPRIVRDVKRRLIESTVLLVLAIALSLWNAFVSFGLYVGIQLFYIVVTTRTTTGVPKEME